MPCSLQWHLLFPLSCASSRFFLYLLLEIWKESIYQLGEVLKNTINFFLLFSKFTNPIIQGWVPSLFVSSRVKITGCSNPSSIIMLEPHMSERQNVRACCFLWKGEQFKVCWNISCLVYRILSNVPSHNKGAFWWHIPLVPFGSVGCALEEEADHDKSSSAFQVQLPKWCVHTLYEQIKMGI